MVSARWWRGARGGGGGSICFWIVQRASFQHHPTHLHIIQNGRFPHRRLHWQPPREYLWQLAHRALNEPSCGALEASCLSSLTRSSSTSRCRPPRAPSSLRSTSSSRTTPSSPRTSTCPCEWRERGKMEKRGRGSDWYSATRTLSPTPRSPTLPAVPPRTLPALLR